MFKQITIFFLKINKNDVSIILFIQIEGCDHNLPGMVCDIL